MGVFPTSELSVSVGVASALLIAANPHRTALILFPPAGVTVTVSEKNPAVLSNGPSWSNPTYPIIINRERFGAWCMKNLFVIASQAFTMGMLEVIDVDLPVTYFAGDPTVPSVLPYG